MAPNSTVDSATASDNFAVLLRYSNATGEKLIAEHAANATGLAKRTVFSRIKKAKEDAADLTGEPNKGAGAEAFKVLLKYAESSGSQLQAGAVATATGLAKRTAFSKLKAAREALGEDAGGEDQAGDSGKEEVTLKSPKKKSPIKKSPTKKTPVKKAVKKEDDDDEVTEPDIVESPRQTRSRGVKRKNYADLDGDDTDQLDDANEGKAGRGGRKTGKKVKTEEEDGEFEEGAVKDEVGEGGGGEEEGGEGGDEEEGGDVEKEAGSDESTLKDEEA